MINSKHTTTGWAGIYLNGKLQKAFEVTEGQTYSCTDNLVVVYAETKAELLETV